MRVLDAASWVVEPGYDWLPLLGLQALSGTRTPAIVAHDVKCSVSLVS